MLGILECDGREATVLVRDSGGELLQYRLVIEPRATRRARHVVGSLLEGWRLGGLADDVVSCVSELVTNVYEHTARSATAELSVSWVPGSSLTVEVRDQDSRLPRRHRTAELAVLPFALIDSEADEWRITVDQVLMPCGHTLATVCPACAQRAKTLRAAQCREGWHLETEPVIEPDPATEDQKWWVEKRAEAQAMHDQAEKDREDLDALNSELDQEINKAGMRGNVLPARATRRHRTTRRRQDAAPLPRRKVAARTVGKVYETPDGKRFRPSLFVTLTCPSYGRVREDGTPADPAAYDYQRAARDALHFAALFDRFVQNLRRFLGYDVQYFAAVEPQRRLAPHIHMAMRGTVSRAELRRVQAATYHQVWWPDTSTVHFEDGALPVWDERTGTYLDPATGEVLPSWDEALDAFGDDDEPLHMARFGERFDAQGVLAGSKDAARCIAPLRYPA